MPMHLIAAESDDIVSYQNSVKAQTTMIANGATQVQVVDLGTGLTHSEAFVPAVVTARQWFDTFRSSSG
jgi:hypothetical protein